MTRPLFPDITVNGQAISQKDIAAEAQNHAAPAGKPGLAWRKAARALAIRVLLLERARAQGLAAEPREVGPGQFETDEEALIRGLLETAIVAEAPCEEEMRAAYDAEPDAFRAPPLWEVSHILCACDPRVDNAREAALARAKIVCAQALADPAGFARLAQTDSDCGSKEAGGALGQLGPGDTVPEFEAALRKLAQGEITPEPVLSRHGWHIIRMDAVALGEVLPYQAVAPRIAEAIERARWARAARDYTQNLLQTAEISGADLVTL